VPPESVPLSMPEILHPDPTRWSPAPAAGGGLWLDHGAEFLYCQALSGSSQEARAPAADGWTTRWWEQGTDGRIGICPDHST